MVLRMKNFNILRIPKKNPTFRVVSTKKNQEKKGGITQNGGLDSLSI